MRNNELIGVLLSAPMRPTAPAPEGDHPMNQVDHEFGKVNPIAPEALSRFAFLIGRWRCEAKVKSANGEWQTFQAKWVGHFILEGYAIADEYRMTGPSGELIVLGMNFRTYDAARQTWNIKWLNALTGTWTDLATNELGWVRFDGQSIIYAFKEPVAATLIRAPHTQTFQRRTSLGEVLLNQRGHFASWVQCIERQIFLKTDATVFQFCLPFPRGPVPTPVQWRFRAHAHYRAHGQNDPATPKTTNRPCGMAIVPEPSEGLCFRTFARDTMKLVIQNQSIEM